MSMKKPRDSGNNRAHNVEGDRVFQFFREIIALPLVIWRFLSRYQQRIAGSGPNSRQRPKPKSAGLDRMIWRISGLPSNAVEYLSALFKVGGEPAARAAADDMMKTHANGFLHQQLLSRCIAFGFDRNWIEDALARDQESEIPHAHMLTYCRLQLSSDEAQALPICDEILARNDYPMYITQAAYYRKAFIALGHKQAREAEEIIDYVLAAGENSSFRVLKMAVSILTGRDDVQQHLRILKAHDQQSVQASHISLAHAAILGGNGHLAWQALSSCSDEVLKQQAHSGWGATKTIAAQILQERSHE